MAVHRPQPRRWSRHTSAALLLLILAAGARAQNDIEYQDRGDRYEGVRPQPVSGYNVELVSALVDYQEPAPALPERIRVRFFLDGPHQVYLSVRELDVRRYYWLDRARPSRPWTRGFANEFAWPTAAVLGKLSPSIALSEIGAVARLDRPEPSADERVSPLILYHAAPPRVVDGYVFALKTGNDARLVYRIHRAGSDAPLFTGPPIRTRAGRAFVVRWDARKAAGGEYRLVLDGYALDSNQRLQQTVRFAHEPQVP